MAKIKWAAMCEESGSDEEQFPYIKRIYSGVSASRFPCSWSSKYICAQVHGSKDEALEVSVSVVGPGQPARQIGERRATKLTQDGEAWLHIKLRPVFLEEPGDYVFHLGIGSDSYELKLPATQRQCD